MEEEKKNNECHKVFRGKSFVIDTLVSKCDEIRELINEHGGHVLGDNQYPDAEYCIVPNIVSAYQAPSQRNCSMVTRQWLEKCISEGCIVAPDSCPVLFRSFLKKDDVDIREYGIVPKDSVVVASISAIHGNEKSQAIHILDCLGMQFSARLTRKVDLLIMGRRISSRTTDRLKYACEYDITVVYDDWIQDCFNAGKLMSPTPYIHEYYRQHQERKIMKQEKVQTQVEPKSPSNLNLTPTLDIDTSDAMKCLMTPKTPAAYIKVESASPVEQRQNSEWNDDKVDDESLQTKVDAHINNNDYDPDLRGCKSRNDLAQSIPSKEQQRRTQLQLKQQEDKQSITEPHRISFQKLSNHSSQDDTTEFTRSVEYLIESNSASNDPMFDVEDDMSSPISTATHQVSQMRSRQRSKLQPHHNSTANDDGYQVIDPILLSTTDSSTLERERQYQDILSSSKTLATHLSVRPVNDCDVESQVVKYDLRAPKTQIMQKLKRSATKKVFLISGFKRKEDRAELIQGLLDLGGEYSDNFSNACTHLIIASPSKTEKFLCSLAAQLWILRSDFVFDSVKKGRWLDEEVYEWTEEVYRGSSNRITEKNAQLCRCIRRLRQSSRKPLQDWHVLLLMGAQSVQGFKNILEAGGASSVFIANSVEDLNKILFDDGTTHTITHIMQVGTSRTRSEMLALINKFLEQYPDTPLVSTDFIMEYLIDPYVDWRHYAARSENDRSNAMSGRRRPRSESSRDVNFTNVRNKIQKNRI